MFTLSLRMLFKLDKRHCFMFSLEIKFDVYLNEKKPLFSVGRFCLVLNLHALTCHVLYLIHREFIGSVSGFDLLLRLIASFWLCVWLQSNSIGFCSFLFTYSGTILLKLSLPLSQASDFAPFLTGWCGADVVR